MRVAEAVLVEQVELLARLSFSAERPAGGGLAADERRLHDLRRDHAGHVGVNAEQLRGGLCTHHVRDDRAPVTALRHEPRVPEALHQHDPGPRDAAGVPAGACVGLPENP